MERRRQLFIREIVVLRVLATDVLKPAHDTSRRKIYV
jgi:hypothetical protein